MQSKLELQENVDAKLSVSVSVKSEQFVVSQWINFAFKLLHDGNRWDSSILEDNGDATAHTC